MKTLAIDVGAKRCGWAYTDNIGEDSGSFNTETFFNFASKIMDLIELWKPDIVVCGKPNRFYNVVACQSKYIGICCLYAENFGIPLVEINDSTVRAKLFPGMGKSHKEDIQKLTGIADPDQNDAIVLARGWNLLQQG